MLLFGDDPERLRDWLAVARGWLWDQLGLQLKPPQLRAVPPGCDVLGVRVRRRHRNMTGSRKRRWAVAMARLWQGLAQGDLDEAAFARRAGSMSRQTAGRRTGTATTRPTRTTTWASAQRSSPARMVQAVWCEGAPGSQAGTIRPAGAAASMPWTKASEGGPGLVVRCGALRERLGQPVAGIGGGRSCWRHE
jgi:hypothetical protein